MKRIEELRLALDLEMLAQDIRKGASPDQLRRLALIAATRELLEALDGLLAHLWDGRKRDVKKDYSLMVAEVAARAAIAKATGG